MLAKGRCYELQVASFLGPRSASPPDSTSSYETSYAGPQTHLELSLYDESAAPLGQFTLACAPMRGGWVLRNALSRSRPSLFCLLAKLLAVSHVCPPVSRAGFPGAALPLSTPLGKAVGLHRMV